MNYQPSPCLLQGSPAMDLDNFKHKQEEDKNLQANAGKMLRTSHYQTVHTQVRGERRRKITYFAKYMYTVAGTTR